MSVFQNRQILLPQRKLSGLQAAIAPKSHEQIHVARTLKKLLTSKGDCWIKQ